MAAQAMNGFLSSPRAPELIRDNQHLAMESFNVAEHMVCEAEKRERFSMTDDQYDLMAKRAEWDTQNPPSLLWRVIVPCCSVGIGGGAATYGLAQLIIWWFG